MENDFQIAGRAGKQGREAALPAAVAPPTTASARTKGTKLSKAPEVRTDEPRKKEKWGKKKIWELIGMNWFCSYGRQL